jgi:tryptophan 2,3-dioxygenase
MEKIFPSEAKRFPPDGKVEELLSELGRKLESQGQNLPCHLEGLVHSRYLTYWDYIQLEVLLNIQMPRTHFADERVFIIYHQITELYFKLIIQELEQVSDGGAGMTGRLRRINRYMDNLIYSFDIMLEGLDQEQFLLFRTALAPASGFQSVQYRLIEMYATDLANLVKDGARAEFSACGDLALLFQNVYWKEGAKDKLTSRKDLSLTIFESKYDALLLLKAEEWETMNLYRQWLAIDDADPAKQPLFAELRRFDNLMNIEWRLSHFKTAVKHLKINNQALKATGGTNWREYLPPRFQRVIFFPSLWTAEERNNWGKNFVEQSLQ